ncbi:MAG: hypothetical protein GPI99_15390 [Microcystis aeruginosa W13-15]|nr:hypothetical protein [Microcystis aeruginosa W13-15]
MNIKYFHPKLAQVLTISVTVLYISFCVTFTKNPVELYIPSESRVVKLSPILVKAKIDVYNGKSLLDKKSLITESIFKDIIKIFKIQSHYSETDFMQVSDLKQVVITPKNYYTLELDYTLENPSFSEQMWKGYISGLTLSIVPIFFVDKEIKLVGTLKGLKGEIIKKYEFENSHSAYVGLFTIPLIPFSVLSIKTQPEEVSRALAENFLYNLTNDIYKNKLIPTEI